MTIVGMRTPVAGAAFLFAAFLAVACPPRAEAAVAKQQRGSVYLMRGFINVFSTGMNTLNDELRAKGVNSTVLGDADWETIAHAIKARYAKDKQNALPVIIMGHSLGANSTELIADELNEKHIPVALIVNFDAVSQMAIPANVQHVMNFYAPDGFGLVLKPGPGFHGRLDNINAQKLIPDVQHITIEKQERLHVTVIAEVLRLLGK